MTYDGLEWSREDVLKGLHECGSFNGSSRNAPGEVIFESNSLHDGDMSTPFLDVTLDDRNIYQNSLPENKKFVVCLTHDVDYLAKDAPVTSLGKSWGALCSDSQLSSKSRIKLATRRLAKAGKDFAVGAMSSGNRRTDFRVWTDIEREFDARSTFFIMPNSAEKAHYTDNVYNHEDTVKYGGEILPIREMVRKLDREGWEIGLHYTWHAATNVEEFRKQKKQVEKLVGKPIKSVRGHYLAFDVERTPAVQQAAGVSIDSTIGFNSRPGFRYATAKPWQLYDHLKETRSSVLEIPLIAQDVSLLRSNRGIGADIDSVEEYILNIADKVERVGGILTLSWHPSYCSNPQYVHVYRRILRRLDKEGGWLATAQDVGKWWKTYNKKCGFREL